MSITETGIEQPDSRKSDFLATLVSLAKEHAVKDRFLTTLVPLVGHRFLVTFFCVSATAWFLYILLLIFVFRIY